MILQPLSCSPAELRQQVSDGFAIAINGLVADVSTTLTLDLIGLGTQP